MALDGITNVGDGENTTQEIASGVDASTDVDQLLADTAVLQDEVPLESGVLGMQEVLTHTQPSTVTTSATGGAAVTFDQQGANFAPGTTTGDYCRMRGPTQRGVDINSTDWRELRFQAVFRNQGGITTDRARIGWLNNDGAGGVFLDVTNNDYVVGTTTVAGGLGGTRMKYLEIVMDRDAGETTFHLGGQNNDTTVVADLANGQDTIAYMESNGGGENLDVLWFREIWRGDER